MSEEKVNIQELAQKVDELLNVLKVVSADLTEVSKSLKAATKPASTPATSAPQSEKKKDINEVKQAFSPELASMLLFEDMQKFVIVKPRRFLGSDNFAKVASVVREIGGEYISAGKESHFKVPKK
ncbi:MAG: hypothetical protein NWF06_06600 [Candidatus Bathyarchaeota archaeon]|nr:hypothetical protein [Candidatus Bathyarchaeum sp.]